MLYLNQLMPHNEKLILHATDKLSFVLGSAGNVDVQFHFIRQDWS